MNSTELSKLPSNRVKVSIYPGLQKEEQKAVKKRSPHVWAALKNLNVKADEAPVIAVLGSGGGLRAHIACLGVLSELKKLGLLDAVTYLSGLSGSTWALSSFYTEDGNIKGIEDELKHRFDQKEWDLDSSIKKTTEAAKLENYSLTDFWAYIVVSKQTRELQNSCLSNMVKHVEEGAFPYPIFAAIDGDLYYSKKKEEVQNAWFEFTPYHAGYPTLGAYVPVTHFGSKFQEGKLVKHKPEPERDLSFLKGLWGSALASLEEIRHYILNQLSMLKEKLKTKIEQLKGTVLEKLLHLVITYVECPNAPSILPKLQDLYQNLEAGTEEEVDETVHRQMTEMMQNWNEVSPDELGRFLEQWIQCLMKQEEDSGQRHSSSKFFLKNEMSEILDICNVLIKTTLCSLKWEWGTTHNFLYKYGEIKENEMRNRELIHLMDAGFAINTPYPLVLLPARNVQLILSFDFSSGDPFETIRSTAKYCCDHKISFPPVDETTLKEWSSAPSSCYILKGNSGPVVMHFPLFNRDNCGDDIQKWHEIYKTFKLADSYSLDLVIRLLELSKENVSKNTEKILGEIKKMARCSFLITSHLDEFIAHSDYLIVIKLLL
ncbi:cytosolic phospholipase A2 gamma [Octodon degus]|uniref:Cytosolic phospholipase A2 gamma n=1 Tax=Octodon degus TaxID=10160 RepID=A0A6P3V975_OCTDE|nr:cytosolic phospholipase A2 gamma [Octodon degus]